MWPRVGRDGVHGALPTPKVIDFHQLFLTPGWFPAGLNIDVCT